MEQQKQQEQEQRRRSSKRTRIHCTIPSMCCKLSLRRRACPPACGLCQLLICRSRGRTSIECRIHRNLNRVPNLVSNLSFSPRFQPLHNFSNFPRGNRRREGINKSRWLNSLSLTLAVVLAEMIDGRGGFVRQRVCDRGRLSGGV
jgi:hypothetical protein